jgi:RND superfamily putative drug exporter
VLLGWIAGVMAIIAVATTAGSRFLNDFGGVGQSQQAQNILAQRFPPSASRPRPAMRPRSCPAPLGRSGPRRHRQDRPGSGRHPAAGVGDLGLAAGHRHRRAHGLSTIGFDAISAKLPAGDVKAVIATAGSCAAPGLQVALGRAPISAVVSPSPGSSEGIGISAVIVIMLVAFGSVVAMGRPSSLPWPG